MKAYYKGICPQCKAVINVDDTVLRCRHDGVWRCQRCTEMFNELGPHFSAPYLTRADRDADNARKKAIIEKFGLEHTFHPLQHTPAVDERHDLGDTIAAAVAAEVQP